MIFIDAGHLRENLKRLFSEDIIDYKSFVDAVKMELSLPYFLFDIVRVYYYDATLAVPDKKEKMQDIHIQRIRNLPGFEDRIGNLKFTKKRGYEQKRVDTLIAVDMLSKAYENHYDIAILLSGDEDHMPVVDAVKNTGKRVFGIFFESGISPMLKEYFDAYFVLNEKWFMDRAIKGKVKILDFVISDKIKTEQAVQVNTTIEASQMKGFIKLLITNSDGKEYDFTCGLISYGQELVKNKELSISFNIFVPTNIKGSKCNALLIIYDKSENVGNIITYNEKEIDIE